MTLTSTIVTIILYWLEVYTDLVRDRDVPQRIVGPALHEEGRRREEELHGAHDGAEPHEAAEPRAGVEDAADEADDGHLGDAQARDGEEARDVVVELRIRLLRGRERVHVPADAPRGRVDLHGRVDEDA